MTMTQALRQGLGKQLERIVREVHRLRNQGKQEGPTEDSNRRHLGHELETLEDRFEILLTRIDDDDLRERWRAHLHNRAPRPDQHELPLIPPLLFKGRAEDGATVVAVEKPDGMVEIRVDGAVARRSMRGVELIHERGALPKLALEGRHVTEVFDAPEAALDALLDFTSGERREPPWEHLRPLLEEGLVDMTFGLTERGRRMRQVRGAG